MAMKRRTFVGAIAAAAILPAVAVRAQAPAKARVVVIGGGFGGTTAAKFLRLEDPGIAVTLVEPKAEFHTCPASNYVIGGFRKLADIVQDYSALAGRHGVRHVREAAVAIDPASKTVRLSGGQTLAYDKLVLSPGVDMRWGDIEGYDEAASATMPHAWHAGPQTALLRRQLEAMPDGGVVALSIPGLPYRCPPGPYERISLIAHYLKMAKPRSKILALDGKDAFSKQALFQDGWAELYKDMIEWVPLGQDGKIVEVVPGEMTLVSEFGQRHKAAVANVIPPQFAGNIARESGLADKAGQFEGWCPIDPFTFESTLAKDVYVIGDAANGGVMPKSGFSASSEAKAVARHIASLVAGRTPDLPVYINTCYSLVAPDYGISVADVFRPTKDGIVATPGAGGLSPRHPPDAAAFRHHEAEYAYGWYASMSQDIWG
ncbi:MAG: cytochrome C [Alphaproteobacteria bacterium]|nr:cytochrome C [Alphaproteobacteria bacterium]